MTPVGQGTPVPPSDSLWRFGFHRVREKARIATLFADSRKFEAEQLSRRVSVGFPGHLARGGPATIGRQQQNAYPPSCAQGTPTDTLPTTTASFPRPTAPGRALPGSRGP